MLVKKDDDPSEEETEKVPCLTEEGQRCVLPFLFSGKMYHTCTDWVFGGDNQGRLWCSTRLDS